MHITEPHCASLMLMDKEHAVRWMTSRCGEKWEIRSLLGRLNALENTDPGPAATECRSVPTSVAARRSWCLIRWFSIGFACGCIAGGIALLAVWPTPGRL